MEEYNWILIALGIGTVFGMYFSGMFSGTDDDCDECELREKVLLKDMGVEVPPSYMSEEDKEVRAIFEAAFARYKLGEARYGVWKKETDKRDLLDEAEQELLDAIVYNSFEISRLRHIKKQLHGRVGAPCGAPWGFP